jgi:hypothetical protein
MLDLLVRRHKLDLVSCLWYILQYFHKVLNIKIHLPFEFLHPRRKVYYCYLSNNILLKSIEIPIVFVIPHLPQEALHCGTRLEHHRLHRTYPAFW